MGVAHRFSPRTGAAVAPCPAGGAAARRRGHRRIELGGGRPVGRRRASGRLARRGCAGAAVHAGARRRTADATLGPRRGARCAERSADGVHTGALPCRLARHGPRRCPPVAVELVGDGRQRHPRGQARPRDAIACTATSPPAKRAVSGTAPLGWPAGAGARRRSGYRARHREGRTGKRASQSAGGAASSRQARPGRTTAGARSFARRVSPAVLEPAGDAVPARRHRSGQRRGARAECAPARGGARRFRRARRDHQGPAGSGRHPLRTRARPRPPRARG